MRGEQRRYQESSEITVKQMFYHTLTRMMSLRERI